MKCVYRESLDYTGDDYTVSSVIFVLYSLLLLWVGLSNDSITDDGETRIIPYYIIIRHRRTLPDMDTPPHPPRGVGEGASNRVRKKPGFACIVESCAC